MSGGVVDDDRPEGVPRHIARNVELIGRRAVVLARCDVEIERASGADMRARAIVSAGKVEDGSDAIN
jgi:hypothetical protein